MIGPSMAPSDPRANPYRSSSRREERGDPTTSTAARDSVVLLCLLAILASIGWWGEIVDAVATFVMGVQPPK